MTDNEIIKCLRHCRAGDCEECKALGVCNATFSFHKNALDLIKSQKEEVERLKLECYKLYPKGGSYSMQVEVSDRLEHQIKSEAIKEFAERLKKHCSETYDEVLPQLFGEIIDEVVKEWAEAEE